MSIHRCVTVDVSIDAAEVLGELETEVLEAELSGRGFTTSKEILDRLYMAKAKGNREEQDRLVELLIWEELGRIV